MIIPKKYANNDCIDIKSIGKEKSLLIFKFVELITHHKQSKGRFQWEFLLCNMLFVKVNF